MPRRKPEARAETRRKRKEAAQSRETERRKAEADRREIEAEKIAPAIMRTAIPGRDALLTPAQWRDPDDKTTRPALVHSFRATSAIWTLYQRSRLITAHHLRAAHQFQRDFEIGHGAKPGRGERSGKTEAEIGAIDRQFAALARYNAARSTLGNPHAAIACAVVLINWGRAQIARWLRIRDSDAMALIAAAMDRLCDHYWPEAVAVPARKAVAPRGVIPLPSLPVDRIGRVDASWGQETGVAIGA